MSKKTFRVQVSIEAVEFGHVYIEADSPEEAQTLALSGDEEITWGDCDPTHVGVLMLDAVEEVNDES